MKRPGSTAATNNDHDWFKLKVQLRLQSIQELENPHIIECFAGEGKLWDTVQMLTKKKLARFRIDANYYPNLDIIGDSLTFIKQTKISNYNVIDLDSWGSPVNHLEVIFQKQFKGIVHCTYCSPISINPDKKLAETFFQVDSKTIKKAPALFAKDTGSMMETFLSKNGINTIFGHTSPKKNYFYFITR